MLQKAMDCDARALMSGYPPLLAAQAAPTPSEGGARIPLLQLVETGDWSAAAGFALERWAPSVVWPPELRLAAHFVTTAARAVLDRPLGEIAAARRLVDAANASLHADGLWTKYQLPYYRAMFDQAVAAARAWELFRVPTVSGGGSDDSHAQATAMEAGISAMTRVLARQLEGWAPEATHWWDAREQLAEMLLLRRDSRQSTQFEGGEDNEQDTRRALALYEAMLETYPRRYRPLAGAAACARALGWPALASRYYCRLLNVTAPPFPNVTVAGMPENTCARPEPGRRPELRDALRYCDAA